MNKSELVDALAAHYDGSRADAARALNAFVNTISSATAAGERVAITGFGVFEKVERPARTVRNPRTGERLDVAATAVPRFRAGTELKAYVSGQRPVPELSAAPTVRRSAPAAQAPAAPAPSTTKTAAAKAPAPTAVAAEAPATKAAGKAEKPKKKDKVKAEPKAKSDKPKGDKKSKGKKK